jgi:hypothetical protein
MKPNGTIRRLHTQSRIEWIDSCAGPFVSVFNRLWLSQQMIRDVCPHRHSARRLVVSMIPLLKWLSGKIDRHKG